MKNNLGTFPKLKLGAHYDYYRRVEVWKEDFEAELRDQMNDREAMNEWIHSLGYSKYDSVFTIISLKLKEILGETT